MDNSTFRSSARQWISGFDTQARRAIAGWRTGGERLGGAARSRWDRAFAESSPKLSEETRRNASHARDVFSRYYVQGAEITASGAERAVETLVQVAGTAVNRAADWQARRA